MSIIKRKHNSNFTVIPNGTLNDTALSYDALGVLAYLLGRPHKWHVHVEQLRSRGGIGRDKTYRLINVLCDAGYVIREEVRDPKTQAFIRHDLVVYDQPIPENPEVEKVASNDVSTPLPEKPCPENKDHIKERNLLSKDLYKPPSDEAGKSAKSKFQNKKPNYTETFEAFWKQYPKTNSTKKKAFEQWRRLDEADQQLTVDSLKGYLELLRVNPWRQAKAADGYLKARMFDDFAGKQTELKPDEYSEGNWKEFCQLAVRTGKWPAKWGPAPGNPNCSAPAELVTPQLVAAIQGRGAAS